MDMTARLVNPDEQLVTVTITMPLKHWKSLRDDLRVAKYPGWSFGNQLASIVHRFERTVIDDKNAPESDGARC